MKTVKAPIPGVITAILVQSGTEVSVGQELCKLEAMKMNNSIRSSRAGKIATIHVSIGQHVKHNDALIEFAG
jgi:biotin carboxyl carrier protein